MPFDSTNYPPSDEVLAMLTRGRADISRCWYAGVGDRANLSVGNGNCTTNTLAVLREYSDDVLNAALQLLVDAHGARNYSAIWQWNDNVATHADVIALYDRAIALRVAEQSKVSA